MCVPCIGLGESICDCGCRLRLSRSRWSRVCNIALENLSQTPLARTSTPLSQEIVVRAGAAHGYQGRCLDFLVVVYSHEACEDMSNVKLGSPLSVPTSP